MYSTYSRQLRIPYMYLCFWRVTKAKCCNLFYCGHVELVQSIFNFHFPQFSWNIKIIAPNTKLCRLCRITGKIIKNGMHNNEQENPNVVMAVIFSIARIIIESFALNCFSLEIFDFLRNGFFLVLSHFSFVSEMLLWDVS